MSTLQIIVGGLLLLAACGSFWLPYWVRCINERRLERHAERRRQQRLSYRSPFSKLHRPMATYIEPRNRKEDNVPEDVTVDVWVNIYGDKSIGDGYPTKKKALEWKGSGCSATLHIKRTVPIGHVDE